MSPRWTRGVEVPTTPWQLKVQNLALPILPLPWQLDAPASYNSRSKNVRFHWWTLYIYIGIHKRMVQFQKLTRNLFLTLHRHNVHHQQRQLSKFLTRYQQFASRAYCGASFQDGVAAGKGFLCAPFWGVQICDYCILCILVLVTW